GEHEARKEDAEGDQQDLRLREGHRTALREAVRNENNVHCIPPKPCPHRDGDPSRYRPHPETGFPKPWPPNPFPCCSEPVPSCGRLPSGSLSSSACRSATGLLHPRIS